MAFDPLFLINVGFYISFAIVFALLAIGFNLQWATRACSTPASPASS